MKTIDLPVGMNVVRKRHIGKLKSFMGHVIDHTTDRKIYVNVHRDTKRSCVIVRAMIPILDVCPCCGVNREWQTWDVMN